MTKKILYLIPLIIFLALALLLWRGLGKDPSIIPSPLIDKPFPAFSLTDLASGQLIDQRKLPKQAFLVNLWATWCPACEIEHPLLLKLASQGIPIVGVNYKDDRQQALAWLAKTGNPYEFSIFDKAGRLGLDLGVYAAPETFIVDGQGIIRYKHIGIIDQQVWQTELASVFQRYARGSKETKK
jgi:cytochrome c biogenesis protein CcmG/thiol:disulfide interchange protein DsbE